MSQRLFSRFTARMQDLRATEPDSGEYPSLWTPTLCVTPQQIFHDYELVMKRLNADSESEEEEEEEDSPKSEEAGSPSQKSVVAESPTVVGSEDDADTLLGDDDDCDSEYCDSPSGRRTKTNISVTHPKMPSPRDSRAALRRKERKQKPYDTKYRSKLPETDTPEKASLKDAPYSRCTYVDPHDGTKCTKINKSAQEEGRHWRSCHLYKEAKAMLTGNMAVGKGTIITSKEQLEEVKPNIQCPFCLSFITRSDAMRRHRKTNCKPV